ncbi:MAG: hypothetical protein ACJ8GN_19440 [Longimicrobiaceae bacterium]
MLGLVVRHRGDVGDDAGDPVAAEEDPLLTRSEAALALLTKMVRYTSTASAERCARTSSILTSEPVRSYAFAEV